MLSRQKLKGEKRKQEAERKLSEEGVAAAEAERKPRDVAVLESPTMEEKKQPRKKRKKVRDKAMDNPSDGALTEEVDDLEARRLRKKMIKANRRMRKEGGHKEGGDEVDRSKRLEVGEVPEECVDGITPNELGLQNGGKEVKQKQKQRKKKGANRWGEKDMKDQGMEEVSVAEDSGEEQATLRDENLQGQYERKKVFVGGMPYSVTEDDIVEYFSDCGRVTELDCVTFPDTGKFRGLVFITFETEAGADKALALDGADMWGRYLKVQRCKLKEPVKVKPHFDQPPSKHPDCLSAYIGNLAWDVSEDELREFFRDCAIAAIRFAHDKDTGEFRGFGHVDFADDKSLELAVSLDQQEVHGRPVKIAYAVPKRH